eukprot:NODE_7_length_67686_cov_1.621421.p32 type:complete len:234 gc:universal NODE_7_length_67686_cov_1.621421:39475-40176(+)
MVQLIYLGKWLRKRKNDGALNRVPLNFYPKVYYVLERCEGLQIENQVLPRNPTVSEKTAQELNFAYQVEAFLDKTTRDPAERQIIVEILVVLYNIFIGQSDVGVMETHFSKNIHVTKEKKIRNDEIIDVSNILHRALSNYWNDWITKRTNSIQKHHFVEDTSSSPTDLSETNLKTTSSSKSLQMSMESEVEIPNHSDFLGFEGNIGHAKRLFYDLQRHGKVGTLNYIHKCVKL